VTAAPAVAFRKLLVANRGEIACRVLRTAKRLGLATVAVYSEADAASPHVALADEAVLVGPAPARESYLRVDALVAALERTGADAVHPGYGLLSENADFAEAVARAGATFVGPAPSALRALGDKIAARSAARSVGLEPPPGTDEPVDPADTKRLRAEALRIGFPVLVKAAGGGGGIGMLAARDESELERAAKSASERSQAAFADARIYLEKLIETPRHIEVQMLADRRGNTLALGERECSVQRRHQKIIEESPSPAGFFAGEAGDERRRSLFERAVELARAVGYVGAGTVELVADAAGNLAFLEVNARLQVEHAVTELVMGLDLVEWQLRIAAGEALPGAFATKKPSGHAIEARLYAEDPERGFVPQPGLLKELRWPDAELGPRQAVSPNLPGLRIDAGYVEGDSVTSHYDPLIAKLVAHAETRERAIALLDRALEESIVSLEGPKGPKATNQRFLRRVLAAPDFVRGEYDTSLAAELAKSAS
jgi:acetyl-CoA carboxylase biotin carboxylase subunit/3-methylcrotonyl-CoA carboxylase alpha subunit